MRRQNSAENSARQGRPERDAQGRLRGGNPGNSGGKPGKSGRPKSEVRLLRSSAPPISARHFKPLLTAYYPLPDVRVYDLRHTHVTHLLAAGTPVHVVAKRVGHASAKMTLDVYGHVLSGQDGDAVAKLEAYWAAGV